MLHINNILKDIQVKPEEVLDICLLKNINEDFNSMTHEAIKYENLQKYFYLLITTHIYNNLPIYV